MDTITDITDRTLGESNMLFKQRRKDAARWQQAQRFEITQV